MQIETIAMIVASMAFIIGLVVLLYEIGVSREHMIIAALIAGLLLGAVIGTSWKEFSPGGPAQKETKQ
jgi:hypothetical protein